MTVNCRAVAYGGSEGRRVHCYSEGSLEGCGCSRLRGTHGQPINDSFATGGQSSRGEGVPQRCHFITIVYH